MLTISHALSVSQAKDYYENEYSNGALVHADYYQEKVAPRGEWFGKLAREWGLVGDVTEEQFYRAIEGKDPNTGEQLVQHIEARKYLNKYGQEVETSEHRAGWDATFSMPKSLVILAYMSGDEKLKREIWQAHINSVNKALVEMEKFACARIDGKWERSGNMIASLHHHERARPDEKTGYAAPEIHTHAVFMNMTRAGDGRLRAMQEIELFRSQAYLTAIYRTGLAEDVQKSGVELRVDLETGAPEVKEISREYIEAASVRSEEVKRKSAEIKERLEAEGHAVKDGAGLRQAAARLNRQGKDFDLEEMIRRDAELEEKFGFQAHRAREAARERGPILRTREEIEQRAGQAVTYGIETAMEREAVNDARLLMTKALQRNMALTTYEAVKAEMEAREASGELTKIERLQKMPERTTPRMLNLERGNIKTMLDGKGTQTPLASGQAAKSLIDEICYRQGITLNQDQYRAVMRLLESRDRIIALQGRAGTGKTTMMRVFREAAERAGFVVQGIAPTNIAAKQLRESGLRTNTLAQFVRSGRKKGEEGKRYFVIDESSLADTKRMNALLKRIGHQDRVQFVGDRDQYQAIEAGAPFEQFQRNGVEVVWLKQVVRQQDPQYREAVMLLQQGKIREAIDKFQAQGRIIEVKDDEERLAAVAELFVRNPENCLAVDPGNVGRVTTNAKVHKLLQQAGRVDSADHKTSILVNREDLTGADRKWAARYKPGADIVRYREGSKVYGVKKGEYGRVTAVDFEQNLLRVKFECGRSLTYNPERLYGVEVFREKQRDFAVGDRVQFRKETDDRKAANGELAVIERIEGKEFLMRLQNGHEVKVDTEKFRHFDYGYSVTSYLSQSQTSPEEIVNIDTQLGDVLVNERLSKVAFTRGVHNIVIVTNSVADLVGALERQKNKEIALDALKESEQLRDWKARGARAEGGEPSLSDQVEHRARAGREATSNELDRDGSREFEHISLDPEIPENLPEPMYNRVILGEALVAGMRYEWAKLDTQAARDYGTAFRLRVRDESTGADRNISQLDVTRRAEARAGRTAARYRHAPGEDRRRIKEQLARQDIVYHGETMKAHSEALTGLVKQREEKEAQARAAHTEAAEQARSVTEKYHSRGEPEPVPYISRETLDRLEEEATRRGLTRQIETLENLREALAPEHGYAMRTTHEAARLAAQAMTARVEHQASLRRLTGFEHTRHTHRYEIDGKKWSLAELDRAIEKYSNQAKILDKYYNLHLDPRSRVAAAAEVERLSEIRQQVGERIKERSNDLAFKVEQSRQRAFVLQAAHEREKAIFISHGFEMPAPLFTSNELKRIEANLPAVRDVNLLRQLSQVESSLDHVNQLGRALAREVIAEIKCHEAAERLQNFEKYGTRQALLIESPDGRLSTYRLQDVKLHSVIDRIFENKEQREIREKVERASDAHHRRLIGECEKSFAYLQTARELAAEQRRAAGKSEVGISAIELTPAEKMRLEIFAEKRSDEGERRHYLRIARESSEHKTEYERRREGEQHPEQLNDIIADRKEEIQPAGLSESNGLKVKTVLQGAEGEIGVSQQRAEIRLPEIVNAQPSRSDQEKEIRQQGQGEPREDSPESREQLEADDIRVTAARELAESGQLAEAKLILRQLDDLELQPTLERHLERLAAGGAPRDYQSLRRSEVMTMVLDAAHTRSLPEAEAKNILGLLEQTGKGMTPGVVLKPNFLKTPPARSHEAVAPNGKSIGGSPAKTRTPRTFTKTVTQNQELYTWKSEQRQPQKLREVKRRNPCPVCEKPNWCSINEDRTFVICKRVPSDHEAKNGKGWVHILSHSFSYSNNRALQTRQVEVEVTQYERADINRRDEINSRLLSVLKLNERDRKNLIARGLDDVTIEKNGYKSVPIPSALDEVMKSFKQQDLRGIPGFFRRRENWRLNIGEWTSKKDGITHSYHQGFLIPVRDVQGRIEGFQVRRAEVRDSDDPRYIWLSSSNKEHGSSSGAPIHFRNIEQACCSGQAIITEGALKADTAAHLLDNKHAVIAVAGVSSFGDDLGQRLQAQIPELKQIIIAFDADAARKPEVQKALERLGETLRGAGLDARELRWEEKNGKGIDDYLFQDPKHRAEVKSFLEESLTSLERGHNQVRNAGGVRQESVRSDHHGIGL